MAKGGLTRFKWIRSQSDHKYGFLDVVTRFFGTLGMGIENKELHDRRWLATFGGICWREWYGVPVALSTSSMGTTDWDIVHLRCAVAKVAMT